ncbi:hypothetical protein LCGC14_2700110 [marine sediment metagenome]|uniref:Uncharacterized protein n=1 Tax=marine sediment metagenome TaxID=412755 RepID=A0A0F9C7S3_9ZZZZ
MGRPKEQSEVLAEFERADGVTLLKVGVGKNGKPYIDLSNYWQLSKLLEALQQAKSTLDKLYG